MNKEINRLYLWQKWNHLVSVFSSELCLPSYLFEEICNFYSESGRAYHNLGHIQFFFEKFENYRDKIQSSNAFELAIWYHDIVYDPLQKNNEIASVELFRKHSEILHIKTSVVKKVEDLIMATEKHRLENYDLEACLFLDLDLLILASSSDRYKEYAQAIRKEFQSFSDKDFYRGRLEFLQKILEKDRVFFTDFIQIDYESAARKNMKDEVEFISQNKILA